MFEHIPKELKELPQWVCWRRKIPYDPRTGQGAKAGQPDTWATFGEAVRAVGQYDGIGFAFHSNGLVGIDLDTVRDPVTGWVDPLAAEIIAACGSYTEVSPSGYGFHIIARAPDLMLGWNKHRLPENRITRADVDPTTGAVRRDKDGNPKYKHPEIEMYTEKRYFTMTGNGGGTLVDAAAAVKELQARFADKPAEPVPLTSPLIGGKDYLSVGLERDHKLRQLWNGERPHGNESSDDQALMNKLAYWLNCDAAQMKAAFLSSPHCAGKDAAHRRKVERADYLDRTITKAIQDCRETAQQTAARWRAAHRPTPQEDFSPSGGVDKQPAAPCRSNEQEDASPPAFFDIFQPLTAFEEQEAEWLIPGWIPKGQVTLFASDGGVGKTSVCCNVTAAVTSGGGSILDPPVISREQGKVLILTTEDSISKKLKKKLRLAGTNQDNVIAPDPALDLNGELRELKFGAPRFAETIRRFKPALCIIDPVQGYVPPDINMGSRNAMRDCMATLTALGEETGCTFLVVCHSNKRRGASGRERISDSSDLWDISRSVIMAGYTSDEDIRYLSNEKNNYAPLQETVLYRMNKDGLPEFVDFSPKRDRDFVQESYFTVRSEEPVNEKLIEALKQEANPFEPVKFSYDTFEEAHGASVWGGKQPKRALDAVKPLLEQEGYSLLTKQVKLDGKNHKGFVLQVVTEPVQEASPCDLGNRLLGYPL